jgi:outer membrane protein assembly factor BamB
MKNRSAIEIRLLAALSVYVLSFGLLFGQVVRPDVQVSITRVNPLDGQTIWSVPVDRKLASYRLEAYTNRIVVFFYRADSDPNFNNSEVLFLDAKTGRRVEPFDTLDFIYPNEDPQIARSRFGSQGSVEEERGEITLPNGWRSHGVAGLSWRNAGSNDIYFFEGSKMEWSMILPEGAYNLSHWNDILIYRRYTEEARRIIDRLYAQPAGQNSTIWVFALPKDLPDRPWGAADFISDKTVRGFSYTVGKQTVFTFGSGTLFALDPKTGKLSWRYAVKDDPAVKKNALSSMDDAEIIEAESGLILFSEKTIVRFDQKPKPHATVLRNDLFDQPSPIVAGGSIYCFTQRPASTPSPHP